jgi:hypothetical protein
MTTETIDKLFLEISQFTQAKTARELELLAQRDQLAAELAKVREALKKIATGAYGHLEMPSDIARAALSSPAPQVGEVGNG